MSSPDPEGMSLLARVLAAGAVVAAPVLGLWRAWIWVDGRFAQKSAVNNQLQKLEGEQTLQRGYFAKVFEKLEEHARRDEDHFSRIESAAEERHRELLMHLLKKDGGGS